MSFIEYDSAFSIFDIISVYMPFWVFFIGFFRFIGEFSVLKRLFLSMYQ